MEQLQEIAREAGVPFILKGIMTAKGAEKAVQAGVAGIVVSNHGGRVLDDCPATEEVLPEIVEAVAGRAKVFVDGGIRTGGDVFKALALGARRRAGCPPLRYGGVWRRCRGRCLLDREAGGRAG